MDENEYKLCPVCGSKPEVTKCSTALTCSNYDCPLWSGFYDVEDWQNQPRVDALTAEVAALRARVAELEDLNSAPVCEWKRESDWDSDTWEAGCGMGWVFEDGGPSENEMNYCPSCGRRLVIIITPPEADNE